MSTFIFHQRRFILLRCHGTNSSRRSITTTANDAAQKIFNAFEGITHSRKQNLDSNQLQKLSLTLNRKRLQPDVNIDSNPPTNGVPLPPGYHLVYFTPATVETELGIDGTDKTFNAPAPFTRRMWAGGKMRWTKGCSLKVGDEVEERTRLLSATPKKSRNGHEMVLVEVEKQLWNNQGLAVVDQRSWIFRPEAPKASGESGRVGNQMRQQAIHGPSVIRDVVPDSAGLPQRQFKWSPVGLFRFSALTFNAHMIHYSESWCKDIEVYPGIVVHGPLNLINMMDYWRDVHGKEGKEPSEISYRALSPVFAGSPYTIRTGNIRDAENGKNWEILVEKLDGTISMRGEILAK